MNNRGSHENRLRQHSVEQFLRTATAASAAAAAFPWIVPSTALGLDGAVAPSEKITLGVIGIGPRCTYDLKAMLGLPDVQCVAIADVQASRREAGKKLVDAHYGNQDCRLYRDFRELLDRKDIDAVLIATGDRWHAPASILAAKAGKDVYSEKPCGLTIAVCQELADTMKRTGRVFQAGTQRRSVPNFQQAVELAHSGKLGKLHTLYASVYMPRARQHLAAGRADAAARRGRLEPLARPGALAAVQQQVCRRRLARLLRLRLRRPAARLGRAHRRPLPVGQQGRRHHARSNTSRRETNITCRYANGVKLVLDFLKTPFGERPGLDQHLGTCPVRFVGDEGWVETGDSGEIEVQPASLAGEVKGRCKNDDRPGRRGPRPQLLRLHQVARPDGANPEVMRHSHIACHAAALSWILKRKLKLDPAKEEFIDDDEANGLRSRPARDPWAV